ncbi:MAG: YARHG domain-containing protein [Cyclobacteriaceae bacterium]|nr:YARHG domain-containing protein [Cyclobacteriaceae bacterium]
MKSPAQILRLLLIYVVLFSGCSVLKKEDPEIGVRNFLAALQADLTKSDGEVLKYFRVSQSREAVLAAIKVFRNTDPFVVCDARLANSTITIEPGQVNVAIPITFRIKELDTKDELPFTMQMTLAPLEKSYVISQFDGEGFYQSFSTIKNRNYWEAEQKLALRERMEAYEAARKLESFYDSVIWYTTHAEQRYFYVVRGSWINTFFHSGNDNVRVPDETRMGLVNEIGETIVPIAFDLVGTLSFVQNNLVEVIRDDKIGYFDIGKRQLVVDTVYNLIIPYGKNNVWAIVKQDSTIGSLDMRFNYSAGFPSPEAEQWFNDFSYLKKSIRLKAGNQAFCEIPYQDYAGNGIIMPPSYLVSSGIFNPIEGHISSSSIPIYGGWIDYKETTGSFVQQITDNLRTLVVTIRNRYLEGREEFYTSNNLAFIDDTQKITSVTTIYGDEVSLHTIDSTLLEVRTPHSYWFGEYEASEELNLLNHTYFSITSGGTIEQLKSDRLFEQTAFVKLDSTYLTGEYEVYDYAAKRTRTTYFLAEKTITFMRDEILADHGYGFPDDDEKREHFKNIRQNYQPLYSSLEELKENLSEIDQYNLQFLNRILTVMKGNLSASANP